MVEAIRTMTVGELVGWFVLLAGGLSTVIEIAPIKINPWTWLARAIGRAINGELIEKVDGLEKKIETMDQDDKLQRAKDARTRVLRFGDELLHDVRHTKEHFDDVLRDITEYEKYCDEHPKFENDQMHITAEHIKETYHKCLKEHSFL